MMATSYKCRICLDYSSSCTSLFSKGKGASIAQMISFCAGVQIIKEDDLPPYACSECCKEATSAYMFVNKCRKSDAELRTQQMLIRNSSNTQEEYLEYGDHSSDSESSKDYINKHVNLELELCTVETLEEENSDDESVLNFQNYHPTGDKELEKVHVDANDCPSLEEEYLHESDTEIVIQYGIERTEDITEDHNLPTKFDRSEQRTIASYVCCHTECTLIFNSIRSLQEHVNCVHYESESKREDATEPTHHRCSNCWRSFPTENDLKTHKMRLELKQASLSRQLYGRPKLYPSIFDAPVKICCGCFERFSTTDALLEHSEKMHAVRKSATNPSRPVQCQICYKLFRSEVHLRTHQIAVYKPRNHVCNVCGASYSAASKLAYHQAQHRTKEKYTCAVCGVRLKTLQNLKMHSLLHQEKREACKTCGLRFHRKSNLKMHQRTHEDTFYHVCTHCPKKLKTLSQLKEHLKVHTKEKPYQCRHCDKHFRYYSDRKRHEMVHTGNYPFECDGCSKKFARSFSYYRHLGKCSQEQGSIVTNM